MIAAVTAFVPIPGHPRSEEEYRDLAAPLQMLALEIPFLATAEVKLEDCWLYQYLQATYGDHPKVTHAIGDNPKKNSLAYHIVQAQKSEFLLMAAQASDFFYDTYVWIDYGIMHVPGVTIPIIRDFMKRANGERTIAIPGCWGSDYKYDDEQPCWRFCGGVIVVPRKYLRDFDASMKHEYAYGLRQTNHVSWEVNMLAHVERHHRHLPIWWYQADHNETMFTNYKATEYACHERRSGSHRIWC